MKFPWKHPTGEGFYLFNDGPEEDVEFEAGSHRLRVSLSDPGLVRASYRVECLTCGEVIHKATSSATIRCEQHLAEYGVEPPARDEEPTTKERVR